MTKQSISTQKVMDCHEAKASRNDGFTLAEVLITLVIIGVIAAITIPTMMNSKNNEELRAGLLKAQSTFAGALEMYYVKNGERLLPQNFYSTGSFKEQIRPFISTLKDCGSYDCLGDYSNISSHSIYKTFNNKTLNHYMFDDGQFIMNDGMLVLIENSNSLFIFVDVNGLKKKPNKAGHDLFAFQITDKGNLVPMGIKGTHFYSASDDYCSKTSNNEYNGYGCTAKALADPNYFKNLH